MNKITKEIHIDLCEEIELWMFIFMFQLNKLDLPIYRASHGWPYGMPELEVVNTFVIHHGIICMNGLFYVRVCICLHACHACMYVYAMQLFSGLHIFFSPLKPKLQVIRGPTLSQIRLDQVLHLHGPFDFSTFTTTCFVILKLLKYPHCYEMSNQHWMEASKNQVARVEPPRITGQLF